MTERARGDVQRDQERLRIGPSAMTWSDGALEVNLDEWSVPLPRRVLGQLHVDLGAVNEIQFDLASSGDHVWRPIAPTARIEVDLISPAVKWRGSAYFDCNFGAAPLESAFRSWQWSRTSLIDGRTAIFYDTERRDGSSSSLGLSFARDGQMSTIALPARAALPKSAWGLSRSHRSETDAPDMLRKLEDGPFYSRSIVATNVLGCSGISVHESLDLDRFRRRWVQCLLPFRMPRRSYTQVGSDLESE